MTINPTSADAGTIVRALRHHARLSQRELAERAGIPKSTLAAIEARRRPARWTTMARLFAATGVQLKIVTDTGAGLPEPHDALDRYGRTRLPAHVDPRPADDHMALHNQFRDDVLGVRRTHTFYHPKPHSRWQRRGARREARGDGETGSAPAPGAGQHERRAHDAGGRRTEHALA